MWSVGCTVKLLKTEAALERVREAELPAVHSRTPPPPWRRAVAAAAAPTPPPARSAPASATASARSASPVPWAGATLSAPRSPPSPRATSRRRTLSGDSPWAPHIRTGRPSSFAPLRFLRRRRPNSGGRRRSCRRRAPIRSRKASADAATGPVQALATCRPDQVRALNLWPGDDGQLPIQERVPPPPPFRRRRRLPRPR